MDNLTIASLYEQAATRIEKRGHWRGWTNHPDVAGRECLITALLGAAGSTAKVLQSLGPIYEDLGFEHQGYGIGGVDVSELTRWNDEQTDGSVVTSRLRKVAGDIRKAEALGLELVNG